MRLISVHVENFGKISDFTYEFTSGLNHFGKDNGWGKSTFATFIRVMFYGFSGEGKRNSLENERKRYEPWQGGTYGGWLKFTEDGKTYIVYRTFGTKAINDTFELRDASTNLVSSDYSGNLGEELFGINAESYARTAYIAQGDAVTHTTDGINAKIGNIADSTADIDRYESASLRLKDALNKMSPTHKTGMLAKLKGEISLLQSKSMSIATIETSMEELNSKMSFAEEKMDAHQKDKEKLSGVMSEIAGYKDIQGKKSVYDRLVTELETRKEAYEKKLRLFPVRVPGEGELNAKLALSQSVITDKRALDDFYMTTDEEASLTRLQEELAPYLKEGITLKELKGRIAGEHKSLTKQSPIAVILTVIAIVCVIIIVVSFVIPSMDEHRALIVSASASLGVIAGICAMLMGKRRNSRAKQLTKMTEDAYDYVNLRDKCDRFEELKRIYADKKHELDSFLAGVGISPEGDTFYRLQQMMSDLHALEDAKREYERADKEYASFAESNDVEAIKSTPIPDNIPDMEVLSREINFHANEADRFRGEIASYKGQMERLAESYDEAMESREAAVEKKAELDDGMRKYEYITKAQQYLAKAKESFTARYMGPLLEGFTKYYSKIDDTESDRFHIDANTELTMDELGAQRDVALLSTGYKDLVGFCMRLSLVEAMYKKEKPVLILDDPFVNLDTKRFKQARKLLTELEKDYQLVYFECRGMDGE